MKHSVTWNQMPHKLDVQSKLPEERAYNKMSYDLTLRDPVTKEGLKVPGHMMYGGIVACNYINGQFIPTTTTEAYLNITYNYSSYYYEAFPKESDNKEQHDKDAALFGIPTSQGGIRTLDGMTGVAAIPLLQEMIRRIERKYKSADGEWITTQREETYWIDRETGGKLDYSKYFSARLKLMSGGKNLQDANQMMEEKYKKIVETYELSEGSSGKDYWTPTAINAIKPLYQLITLSQMRPDGVWTEES